MPRFPKEYRTPKWYDRCMEESNSEVYKTFIELIDADLQSREMHFEDYIYTFITKTPRRSSVAGAIRQLRLPPADLIPNFPFLSEEESIWLQWYAVNNTNGITKFRDKPGYAELIEKYLKKEEPPVPDIFADCEEGERPVIVRKRNQTIRKASRMRYLERAYALGV